MYVIKFNDKYYFEKDYKVGTDLDKAILYHNKEKAREVLKICLANYEKITGWEDPDDGPDSFRVVEVELREKNRDPFCLNMTTIAVPTPDGAGSGKIYEIVEKIQRGAYARPLIGMSPRSPRYTKIVNGKLVTVYHAIGNEERVLETCEFDIEDEGKTYEWVE